MKNFLSMLAFDVALFLSLILSLPASALAQQEVDPTYYNPVPAQTAVARSAGKAEAPKQASNNRQGSKARKQAARPVNAQQLIAKK